MKKEETEVIINLEDTLAKFVEIHKLLAKTKMKQKEYEPISRLLAEAKLELYQYIRAKDREPESTTNTIKIDTKVPWTYTGDNLSIVNNKSK